MINFTLQTVIALALGLLFVSAGLHKLRDKPRFEAQLAEYRLLPTPLVAPVAIILAAIELLLAPAMLLPTTRALAGIAAAAMLSGYAIAIAINLMRGRDYIDCGCGDRPQMLTSWLLLRNAVLAGGALLLTLTTPGSGLSGIDLLVAVPAFLVICLVYQAGEQLLENASVLREWRDLSD